MIAEGSVSLWLGHAPSEDALERAFEERFTDDGDAIDGAWVRGFGVDDYDHDHIELAFHASPIRDLKTALTGHSYIDTYLPRVEALKVELRPDDNITLAYYDYRHSGEPREWTDGVIRLRFVGVVDYR